MATQVLAPVVDLLLVEDNADEALLLLKRLDPEAFSCTHVETLEAALDVLRSGVPVGCVLLDLSLPDADGMEGLERLAEEAPGVPVVVLTGNADKAVGLEAMAMGAQDYLVKGIGDTDVVPRAVRYSVERSRTEAALAEVRARFQHAFEDGPLGIVLVTHDQHECRIIEANRHVQELLGRDAAALVGRRFEELTHWQDRTVQAEVVAEVFAGAALRHSGEWRLIRADGSVAWCRISGSAIHDASGKLLYGIFLIDDITDRRLQEEALHEAHVALDTAILGIVLVDLMGRCRTANRYYARATGYPQDELLGLPWTATVHRDDRDTMAAAMAAAADGEPTPVEVRGLRKDGSTFDQEVVVAPNRGSDGALAGLFLFMRDVSERRTAQRALEDSEARYRRIIETANDGVWVVDPDDVTTFVNPRMAELLGHAPEEMVGRPFGDFLLGYEAGRTVAELDGRSAEDGKPDCRFRRADGSTLWAMVSTAPMRGTEAGMLAMVSDITDRKRAEEQIARLVLYDELTSLPNRALLDDRLRHALRAASRRAGLVGVMFIDIDGFKTVNDGFGHGVGDELLRAVVPRLRGAVRAADTVGRFGGDEFVVVCEDLADVDAAVVIAQRILEALAEPFDLAVGTVSSSASIGITVSRSSGTDAADLLRDADIAMYRAKSAGGGRLEVFDSAMRGDLVEELSLEQDLRLALRTEQLSLHFQPKLTLPDERIVGFEALIRWEHPTRGRVPPPAFIRIAERSSLIVSVGTWVLTEACRQLKRWGEEEWAHVAVNVSAREVEQPDFVDRVQRILEETGVAPDRIELEITETVLFHQDPAVTAATLGRLAELGVRVVLDDFGTGYSSLSYLTKFPIAGLKLDRGFISGFTKEEEDAKRPIVEAVTAMAHALGLTLVGEGVETAEQGLMLAALGCDQAQGYLFSPPMPAGEVERWIAARPKQLELETTPAGTATPTGWMPLGEAATALGVSASTLRRWADDGRVAVQRTEGGHRRFAVADLKAMAPTLTRPRLHLGEAPASATPHLAQVLDTYGERIVEGVISRLYERPARGWFATERAQRPVERWLGSLVLASRTGAWTEVSSSTAALARTAEVGGASLLECSLFLERFTATTLQALQRDPGVAQAEVREAQRAMALTRRALLEER